MQSEKEMEFNAFVKEKDTAWKLLCQLNNFTKLLWDHYELVFLEKLRERELSSSEPDSVELPF